MLCNAFIYAGSDVRITPRRQHPSGEKQTKPFQLGLNGFLKVAFQGSRLTSDGRLILVRELDEHLGLSQLIEQHLTDPRGTNTRLPLPDLLRQSVYSRLAGHEDVNDAERVSVDPAFRLIGSEKIWDRGAALTSRLQSFETDLLGEEGNLAGLGAIIRELLAKAEAMDATQRGARCRQRLPVSEEMASGRGCRSGPLLRDGQNWWSWGDQRHPGRKKLDFKRQPRGGQVYTTLLETPKGDEMNVSASEERRFEPQGSG